MQESSELAVPLKERLFTTWHRLRYGLSFRSSVEIGNDPIWILGKCYFDKNSTHTDEGKSAEGVPPHVADFIEHFYTLTWMTYRANFDQLEGSVFTTDCGWGCMIRSGQMLLAQVIHRHCLKHEWRYNPSGYPDAEMLLHKKIVSWFADSPNKKDCPFSLHSLMEYAKPLGHQPGDWFGPSQVAQLIKVCVNSCSSQIEEISSLFVYVAQDCTVYVGDVMECDPSTSLLILVPVRLGSESLNPIYIQCVQSLLALDHCVGIIGGRPRHSVYFVGFQGEKLIHLDPHYCQSSIKKSFGDNFDIRSYHCKTPRKLSVTRMDPSCTVGFYCRNRQDFEQMRRKVEPLLAPPMQLGVYPFFTFSDKRLSHVMGACQGLEFDSLSDEYTSLNITGPQEEFVVLDYRTDDESGNPP